MTTFTWSFPAFDVAKSEDGLTDVVKKIHWRYDAVDGDFSAGCHGAVNLGSISSTDFVPFANLTEAWAIAAIALDVSAMQATLYAQIATAKNPPVVLMVPPFQQTA